MGDYNHIPIPRHGFASTAGPSVIDVGVPTSAPGYRAIFPSPSMSCPRDMRFAARFPGANNAHLGPEHAEAAEQALCAFIAHLFYAFISLLAVACAYRPIFLFTTVPIFLLGRLIRKELIKLFPAAGVLHRFLLTLSTNWLKTFASPKLVPLVVVGLLGLSATAVNQYLTDEAPAIPLLYLAFALLAVLTFLEGDDKRVFQQSEDDTTAIFDAYGRHSTNDHNQWLPFNLYPGSRPFERFPGFYSGPYGLPGRRDGQQQPSPPSTNDSPRPTDRSRNTSQKPITYFQ